MSAELAIVNAAIRTLDPERPFASAVAVRAGTIIAVGDDVSEHLDARTEVIDARGNALVPGLVDAHIHPFWGAELARGTDLSHCTNRAQVLAALRASTPERGWVFAYGLDYDAAPTARQIGEAVGGAPVFVRLSDLHTALASPRALELAQVTGAERFPDGSAVVVDQHGPTGELHELSAQELVLRAAPELTGAQARARYVAQLKRLNALGLTGGHVMDGSPASFDLMRELEARGELTLRVRVPLWQTPEVTDEEIEAQLPLRDERGELWSGGVAKFFADGVIDAGTAWLEAPDSRGEGTLSYWPDPRRLAHVIERFARAGFQCATHAIGDAAVRFTLNAYAQAGGGPHRLEHLETLPDDLVAKIPALGVIASMQPIHRAASGENWAQRLGPERAARGFRMRDLLDAGAVLALGSDWPVADADPRLGLEWAQRLGLTAEEALAGYTLAPAIAAGEAAVAGRIREGMRADLTGLVAPSEAVWLTVVGGRVVHYGEVVDRVNVNVFA